MKLTVLTDNTTRIDAYYLGEPGVSYYLEDGEEKILFDTGYSDVYLHNADLLGIDLTKLSAIVFSHGHDDHTRGLLYFPETERKITVYGHPGVLEQKRCDGLSIGMPMTREELEKRFEKNFKQFTDAMNSKKKGKFVVDAPVLLDFSY